MPAGFQGSLNFLREQDLLDLSRRSSIVSHSSPKKRAIAKSRASRETRCEALLKMPQQQLGSLRDLDIRGLLFLVAAEARLVGF
jgi:hypothetical protein